MNTLPIKIFATATYLLLCLSLTTCSTDGLPSEEAKIINTAIKTFDPSNIDESFLRLENLIIHPQWHKKIAKHLAGKTSFKSDNEKFATLYLLTLVGNKATNESQIKKFMTGDNPQFKVMAAARLISWGDIDAIPVLIDSLTNNQQLPYSKPPRETWTLAYKLLPRYTEQNFGLNKAKNKKDLDKSQRLWTSWWVINKHKIKWVTPAQKFKF